MANVRARRRRSAALIEELARELAAVGVRGRRRDRILTEFTDHLGCDPEAQLGDPRLLAAQFADELASDAARRTALWTLGALAAVALALIVPEASLPQIPDIASGRSILLAGPATLAVVIGSQIAFAAGCLAAVRALRLWRAPALPAQEVAVLRRRVAVALGAGVATATGSALYAINFWSLVPGWWAALALAAVAAAAVPLGAAIAAHVRAAPLQVSVRGTPGGLSADLGVFARPGLIGAATVLTMLVGTAAAENSFVEGALRAGFEAALFAACFLGFRRFLALTG